MITETRIKKFHAWKLRFKRGVFNHTTLNKTDFSTSHNNTIDPELNRIKKTRFSLAGLPGLLDKHDIEIE